MQIKRIPTKMERWFLAICTESADQCARASNDIGTKFWAHILALASQEFYYGRR